MAHCRRNPPGEADPRRRAALLVVAVSHVADTASSSPTCWSGRLAVEPSAAAGGWERRSYGRWFSVRLLLGRNSWGGTSG